MKKKTKVSKHLIALMCLGTAGLSGAASVVLLRPTNSPSTNENVDPDKIDLSTFNNSTLTEEFIGATEYSLLRAFAKQFTLTQTDDLEVEITDLVSRTFKVTTKPNSYYYVAGKSASCSWTLPETGIDWTTIYPEGANLVSHLAIWEDTQIGRNEILADLAVHYPAIDVNQLWIDTDVTQFDQVTKSANIRVVEGSTLYNGALRGTVTAGFVQATELKYNQQTLTQDLGTANATFIYKGTALANNAENLTWTITPAVTAGITTFTSAGANAGRLEYASAKAFLGAMYAITATYVDADTITWHNTAYIYVQANNPYTLSNVTCNIKAINQLNQTATFTFHNGIEASAVTSWAVSPSLSSTGLEFGGGTGSTTTLKITTLKTTNVTGGIYTVTATFNGFKYNYAMYVETFYATNSLATFTPKFGTSGTAYSVGTIYTNFLCVISVTDGTLTGATSNITYVNQLPEGYVWDGEPAGSMNEYGSQKLAFCQKASSGAIGTRSIQIYSMVAGTYEGIIVGMVRKS